MSSWVHLGLKRTLLPLAATSPPSQHIEPIKFPTIAPSSSTSHPSLCTPANPHSLLTTTPLKASQRPRANGYIPRPRNAFILFRSHFIKSRKVSGAVEPKQSSISKITGSCWRSLPQHEKEIYYKLAKVEELIHAAKYPSYKFSPCRRKTTAAKRAFYGDKEQESKKCKVIADLVMEGFEGQKLADILKASETLGCAAQVSFPTNLVFC